MPIIDPAFIVQNTVNTPDVYYKWAFFTTLLLLGKYSTLPWSTVT